MGIDRRRLWRRCFGTAVCGVALALFMRPLEAASADNPAINVSAPTGLTALGLKFNGAPSCASEKCHGAEKATPRLDFWGDEYTLWHGHKDPHHKAYRDLLNAKSKEIAAKLHIAQANKSAQCTVCHTTVAVGPKQEDLQGKEYSAAEGVSCDSCHGPSQKYFEPHAQTGWIQQQRQKLSHREILTTFGLFDTLPALQRVDRCVGCHMSTSADIVAAGHPPATFEISHFTKIYQERHWNDAPGPFGAQLWACGQVVELREALANLSGTVEKFPDDGKELDEAFSRVQAHFSVLSQTFSQGWADAGQVSALQAALKQIESSMAGKDPHTIHEAALRAFEAATAIQPAITQFKPDEAATMALLSAIGKSDIGAKFGVEGQEQQAYAVDALAASAGADAVGKAVAAILPKKPGEAVPAAEFAKGLELVRAQLK
jgi:hypothetical protein